MFQLLRENVWRCNYRCSSLVRFMSSYRPKEETVITSESLTPVLSAVKKKVNILTIENMYRDKVKICVMTAHDYPSALLADKAHMDITLVGDSLAMVALGHVNTLQITMDEMIHHCKAVSRGSQRSMVVADMPFGSYNTVEQAVANAVRFVKEAGVEAVKIEGGCEIKEHVKRIVDLGIPVMGHVGLTPQKHHALGGFRVQGKTVLKAVKIWKDSQALQEAGCFSIVLEAIPETVSSFISNRLKIPTIGIGAGRNTSGQVLVQLDMLGMYEHFVPKFCKQYANMSQDILQALKQYRYEVKHEQFPTEEHCYPMKSEDEEAFLEFISNHYTNENAISKNSPLSQTQ